jgi:AcrR family transcriptional regulator
MPPVKSRREQYSDATRAALLDAATAQFAERGYTRTALDDVAAATQVTRGAVYHHFDGKKALFEAVLDRLETQAVKRITDAAAQTADPWDAALAGVDAFLDQCCEADYGRVVWQEGPIALGWRGWKECEEKYAYGLTEQFLRSLMDAGYIDPVPLETTTRLVFGLLGAAGLALAEADVADKARTRDDCAALLRRILAGLRGGSG